MAYFDSPKNRALWNRDLQSLTAERERRKENPDVIVTAEQIAAFERPSRIPVTLEQLVAAEKAASGHAPVESARTQATMSPVHSTPSAVTHATGPPVLHR